MRRATAGAFAALALAGCVAGCAVARRTVSPAPVTSATDGSTEELAALVAADARRSDHEPDSNTRAALATAAAAAADACLAREPRAAACLYGHALALGLAARVHPTRAGELLEAMLGALAAAEAADPLYDAAGPARVRALVLIRAPGWPLGPGDVDAGLAAARRAVSLRPQYPPNQLALAEALGTSGDLAAERAAYGTARARAQELPESADRGAWLREADEALRRLRPSSD